MPVAGNRRVFGGGTGARGIKFIHDANCVLWLPGQDDAYSSTIRDKSGNLNNGTITGATWVKNNQGLWSLSFNGAGDEGDCGSGSSLTITDNITIEGWVKLDNLSGYDAPISKGIDGNMNWGLEYTRTLRFYYYGTTWHTYDTGSNVITDTTTWHHFATTNVFTAANCAVYLDGVVMSGSWTQGNGTEAPLTQANPAKIGWCPWGTLPGDLALLRVYNRILGSSEVASHFRQERHLFGV